MLTTDDEMWYEKMEEIKQFQKEKPKLQLGLDQANQLIEIYTKYRNVFLDKPGRVKNYQCQLNFREPVAFNRKSYPIPKSMKGAVREEIRKMLKDGII